jgi:type I restriction enzyme, S subunit
MITHWQTVKLKELCQRITVGHVGSMMGEYQESGIPFLRSLNVTPFGLSKRELKFIDRTFHEKLKKSALKPGDVAVVRTGYPGTACVIPSELGEANCSDLVLITPGADLNPYFLAAIFNSAFGKDLVGGNLVGAAQQHFNITTARELKLRIPPKQVQDKIAAILTSYDDFIETNKRRIALLEKMAEEVYREWFVRLRFPAHQNIKFIKGVPEGWEAMPSSKMFDVLSGGTPRTDIPQFWDGPIPFFTPKDAPDHIYVSTTEKWITEKGLSSCNSRLYPKNTIFITARGTVGKLALAQCDMAMNQSCYALVPKFDAEVYFFYLAVLNAIELIKGASKSGVFDNIIIDTFRIVPIYFPGLTLIKSFNDLASPIFSQLEALLAANVTLTKTRDLLLPRLISGKLSVADLDIQFPPSMRDDIDAQNDRE